MKGAKDVTKAFTMQEAYGIISFTVLAKIKLQFVNLAYRMIELYKQTNPLTRVCILGK